MPTVKNPCKDCPRKGCGSYHGKCQSYIAFTEAMERIRQVRNGILHSFDPSPRLERNIRNKMNRTKK